MTRYERQQQEDAQAFADYLDADSQQAREDIARQLARSGYLTGVMVGSAS
jgi:hypothetical protein